MENGEITIDGVNIKDMKVKSLRALMGNVNQEAILFLRSTCSQTYRYTTMNTDTSARTGRAYTQLQMYTTLF